MDADDMLGCCMQTIQVTVPDDGIFTGGTETSLTLTSSSISPPYNGLSLKIPVAVNEERPVGLTVRDICVRCGDVSRIVSPEFKARIIIAKSLCLNICYVS
jgi:hypothetical protein